jgi:oxalate---CoA ligase
MHMTENGSTSTLAEILERGQANRTALILPDSDRTLSYGDLRWRVESLARALCAAGIRRGNRVAMAMPNGLGIVIGFFAAASAGTAAPLNPAFRYDEFCFYLKDLDAKLLLVPESGGEEAARAARDCGIPILYTDDEGNMASPTGSNAPEAAPDAVALMLNTSGSTGLPKRVPLRHSNLTASIRNIAAAYALGEDDVSLCLMPLFHIHGLMASLSAPLYSGGAVVLPTKFSPMSFWRLIRNHHVTWYSGVPAIHQLILARPAAESSLRFVRSCSAALAPYLILKLEAHFGLPVIEAYGMTEGSHQIATNPLPPGVRKHGSVGLGAGPTIRIFTENGAPAETGVLGEICITGSSVVREYDKNPEANASSFFGAWLRTGDQGRLDADGYLYLTGRFKELINRGGEKIAPREIDEVLTAHPKVAEAVCFGVPHPVWGEEVAAAIVTNGPVSERALISWCKDRMASFKCPKKIHLVTTIPRTATGKIQRAMVAAAIMQSAEKSAAS